MSERISKLAALRRCALQTIQQVCHKLTVFTLTSSHTASPCTKTESTKCNERQPETQAQDAGPASFAKGSPSAIQHHPRMSAQHAAGPSPFFKFQTAMSCLAAVPVSNWSSSFAIEHTTSSLPTTACASCTDAASLSNLPPNRRSSGCSPF